MTLRDATPGWIRLAYRHVRLRWHAGRLMRAARDAATPAQWFELVGRFPAFLSIQQPSEIIGLLELVRQAQPQSVCEIGSALGGTSFLLTRAASPRALVVLIDPAFDGARTGALRRFAGPTQRMVCIGGSSTDPGVRRSLEQELDGRPLDFLFIDGDHSWDGIRADWEGWAALVEPGGVVCLHDSRATPERPIADAGSVRYTEDVIARDPRFEVVEQVATLTVLVRRERPAESGPEPRGSGGRNPA